MHMFIDEGGTFVPTTGWGVVCCLALPHKEVGPARREVQRTSVDWPRKGGELKGGMLQALQLEKLVDILFRHDAILHACAIDVSRENDNGIDHHKKQQAEGITKHLTTEHTKTLIGQVWSLRRQLERMPPQLYIQATLMSHLVWAASEQAALYFSQRRPRELGNFEWTIDAKDPRRITTYENWWKDTLGPLLESKSRREPMICVADAGFDYRYFDRSFAMKKTLWRPDRREEIVDGYDIHKMIARNVKFVDSRDETLIQAVDILASFLRRLLAGDISELKVAETIGRLQIMRNRGGNPQSLQLLTLTRVVSSRRGRLFQIANAMSLAGRVMIKPERRTRGGRKG